MSLAFESIEGHRKVAGPFVLGLTWLMVPITAGLCWLQDADILKATGVGLACAMFASAVWAMVGQTPLGRALSGVFIMAEISIMVANGGAWQIDLHMAYFAALALLLVYCDWAVIAAAAATVAIHHVVLSYVVPSAVFVSGSASFERVLLHAVILLVEAGSLIWVTSNLARMFTTSSRLLASAVKSTAEAKESHLEVEGARGAEKLARDQAESTGSEARTQERAMVVASIGTAISFLMRGDLTHRIEQPLPGEYGTLCNEFNDAVAQLQQTMTVVATNAAAIMSGVSEVSSSSDDLSRRTEQQAASIEETAATLDEINATVRKTAENSRLGRQVVGQAKQTAEHSGMVVCQAVEAMSVIEKSSVQIGQIIGVIDEIAFQTNLLALNAGIEAARVGDAGRGFAVVASEVRALAQRSAEAAKEIKALISASSAQVKQGVQLVGETGKALATIVSQVTEINGIVSEIAASAQDQATSLDQVNTAVNQMDQVTQQNAAMVEESTAASRALAHDTQELVGLMSRFAIGPPAQSSRTTRARRRVA